MSFVDVKIELIHEKIDFSTTGHSAVYYEGDIYIFGASTVGSQSELVKYDVEQNEFEILTYGVYQVSVLNHFAWVCGDEMFIYGGYVGRFVHDKIMAFDFLKKSWREVKCTGTSPSSRFGQSACIIDKKLFVYGGIYTQPLGSADKTDFFLLNLSTSDWTRIEVPDHLISRFDHSVVSFLDSFYVFGGEYITESMQDEFSNDLWMYNVTNNTWRQITAPFPTIGGLSCHRSVIVNDCMYIVGGYAGFRRYSSEIYQFDLYKETWRLCDTSFIEIRSGTVWNLGSDIYYCGGYRFQDFKKLWKIRVKPRDFEKRLNRSRSKGDLSFVFE